MSCARAWKVYGAEGHRMKESFGKSSYLDCSNKYDGVRIISVWREDILNTNEYVIVVIERNTEEECLDEFRGQLSDGVFENCRTGIFEEIDIDFYCSGAR